MSERTMRHRKSESDKSRFEERRESQRKGISANKGSYSRRKQVILGIILSQVLLVAMIYLNPKGYLSQIVVNQLDSLVGGKMAHAVVIDAGSTGSRVLAFSLHHSLITGELVLDDELWHEVKPGLSSFADDPEKGGETIQQLIKIAKGRVPEQVWSQTPITLKATAGLRLLPEKKAEDLLNTVDSVIKSSGFKVAKNEPPVEIMSGLDEGVFGWVTINFLLKTLSGKTENTVVALDLGGGSTQITFLPALKSTLMEVPSEHLHSTKITGEPTTIYSHSYLGAGLMAARKAVFEDGKTEKAEQVRTIESPCVLEESEQDWTFHDVRYQVKSRSDSGFLTCAQRVETVISAMDIVRTSELTSRDLVAFSYFYDRGVEAGLIGKNGGYASVGQFKEAADTSCSKSTKNNPFLCLDLTFIYKLLSTGYGLPDSQVLGLFKKIDGHETSWALGAAFGLLQKMH